MGTVRPAVRGRGEGEGMKCEVEGGEREREGEGEEGRRSRRKRKKEGRDKRHAILRYLTCVGFAKAHYCYSPSPTSADWPTSAVH